MEENKKVYEILYGRENYNTEYCRGWFLYEHKIYFEYEETYSKMVELKEQFPDRVWAIREVTYLSLDPGVIKAKI